MAQYTNVDAVVLHSGGAGDPKVLAGTADPSVSGGLSAPEGSIYLRYVSAAGEIWKKTGTGDTAWTLLGAGGGGGTVATYERSVEAVVEQGSAAEVAYTTGHATYAGSAIGLSVSLNDVVESGTVTVTLKVAGSVVLTVVLNNVNPSFRRDTAAVGAEAVAVGDQIVVGITTDTLVTTGAGSAGITINATLVNNAVSAAAPGFLDSPNVYTKSQSVATEDLGNISGAVAVDAEASNTFKGVATAAVVIGAPSAMYDGWTVVMRLRQGGAGNFAITFNAAWDFGSDGAPDTSGDATDTLLMVSGSSDGTNIFASWRKGYANT